MKSETQDLWWKRYGKEDEFEQFYACKIKWVLQKKR